ncbi:MAG: response regulator transcription factor [Cyclobacteriaceae bacterium]|nr:response regulator transcription factor [Cyclobacteriaceae bacterium]
MGKIKCLVVDDEQLARTLLENFISKIPDLVLVAKCKNAIEATTIIQQGEIDLLFLDIQMPDLTGVDLLKSLRQKPLVIFTTAYAQYAVEGFELDAIDYLLKPFSFDRFVQAVNKATEYLQLKSAYNGKVATAEFNYLVVNADHRLYKIPYDDIEYIEGLREYVSIYTPEKRIIALLSLKSLEEQLPSDQFIRVHKSYIVPLLKIKAMEGNQVEIGKKMIPVGRSYRETVLKIVFNKDE